MAVDWHPREAVAATKAELVDRANALALVAVYVEGLESAAAPPVSSAGNSRHQP